MYVLGIHWHKSNIHKITFRLLPLESLNLEKRGHSEVLW